MTSTFAATYGLILASGAAILVAGSVAIHKLQSRLHSSNSRFLSADEGSEGDFGRDGKQFDGERNVR